jgi:hypothetical protein
LPPFCGDGVVGYELMVCWFGGLEDAVSFVGLGEGGAGFGVGFELVDYGVEVERYQFVDVARMLLYVSIWKSDGHRRHIPSSRRRDILDTL